MSSVDSLTRELDIAKRAGSKGGGEEEETEWRKKCRDMEFQKNRVAVELSNAKFQVSFLLSFLLLLDPSLVPFSNSLSH